MRTRTRLISLLTAGALAISSLVIAGSMAQADDDTTSTISGTLHLPAGYELADATSPLHGRVYADEVVQTADGWSRGSEAMAVPNADGSYSLTVKRGSTYVVWAPVGGLSQGNNTDLLPAVAGGYLTESRENIFDNHTTDLSDPAIAKYAIIGDITVDLAMTVGAKITGTVYMPDGTPVDPNGPFVGVFAIPVSGYGTWIPGHYAQTSIGSDGSYSITVVPGRDYVVRADTDDYLTAWVGGFVGAMPTLPDAHVTQITAPTAGQSKTGQDIRLVQGSMLQGTIYMPDGTTPISAADASYSSVWCSPVNGSVLGSATSVTPNADGFYSCLTNPGQDYVIEVGVPQYPMTWLGGRVGGSTPTLPDPKVTEIPGPTAGQIRPEMDITLVAPVTVTGTVQPPAVVQDGSVNVYVCPTFVDNPWFVTDGQTRYPFWASGGDSSTSCRTAVVAAGSDGAYSVQVTPGVDYAVIGRTAGYDDTWHGGLVSNTSIFNGREPQFDSDGKILSGVLPSTGVALVSGEAGETVSGADVIFGEFVPPTAYMLGYSFGCDSPTSVGSINYSSVPAGEVVQVSSTPGTCDGYTFSSWNTKEDGSGTSYAPGDSLTVTGDVTLFAQWSEVPTAEVVKPEVIASTTGGAARLANGTDSYTLITTLRTGDGEPVLNQAGNLSATTSADVTVSGFTDNHNGTYGVTVASSVPGNYLVTVKLNGVQVGSPIPVNFIGASIEEQVRAPGEFQEATGLGFLPGEDVYVTVHSDPINIGKRTADAQGRVPVTFDVPKGFDLSRHTVEFVGVTSGTATVSFSVATPTADSSQIQGQTGGTATSQTSGSLLVLAGVLVVAGLLVQRLRLRTVKRG